MTVKTAVETPRYFSTRDEAKALVSFEDALLKGLAPDGGLFVPDFVPRLELATWQDASSLADLGVKALSAWLGKRNFKR